MAKRNKIKSARPLLKLEALEQRQLLAGGFTAAQGTEYSNIEHANGNVYDQVLMKTSAITVSNDANQITRVSFLDLQGDIVQAEFSGAGTLSISLESATGPAAPTLYAQSDVSYMSGLASFTIQGSDSTTNFTLFSVGSGNAHRGADNPIFAGGLTGGNNTADVARLTIVANPANPNGSAFGGIRAGNAIFSNSSGVTGISAAGVQVQDVVIVGNINATASATPTLIFGANSQFGSVTAAGGGLLSANGAAINNTGSYAYGITLDAGTNSAGVADAAETTSSQNIFTANNPFTIAPKILTTASETLVGTNGNDSFAATPLTLNIFDNLDGRAGTDSLVITDVSLTAYTFPASTTTITGIETFGLSHVADAAGATDAIVFNVSTLADARTLTITTLGSTPDVTVTGSANLTAVTIAGSSGAVTIADSGTNGASTTDRIATVTLDTVAGAGTLSSEALTTLNLTSVAGTVTNTDTVSTDARTLTVNFLGGTNSGVVDSKATTVNVLTGGSVASVVGANSVFAAATSLNYTANTALTSGTVSAAAALTVNATANAVITATTLTTAAATTVNVTANAAITAATLGASTVTALNLSGSAAMTLTQTAATAGVITSTGTGARTLVTALGDSQQYTGADGADTFTVGATTKAITTGAGSDVITLTSATLGLGGSINAGAGDSDSLSTTAAHAATSSATAALGATYAAAVSGFEKLVLTTVTTNTVNVARLGSFTDISSSGDTGLLTLDGVTAGSTLRLTAAGVAQTVSSTAALLSGAADTLNVVLTGITTTADVAFSTTGLTATDVETINLTSSYDSTMTSANKTAALTGSFANGMIILGNQVKTIVVGGAAGLNLVSASTALTSLDASSNTVGSTGEFSWTSGATGAAVTVKGLAAGINTIVLSAATVAGTYTGSSAGDTVTIANALANVLNLGNGTNLVDGAATGNNVVTGGTGGDTFTSATTGNNVVDFGNGANAFTATTGNNTYTGGTGVDTVSVGAGLNVVNVGADAAGPVVVDAVTITGVGANGNIYTTITNMAAGDTINLQALTYIARANGVLGAKITLGDTASFTDYLNTGTLATIADAGASTMAWFQYAGNTYIVVDTSVDGTPDTDTTSFSNGVDSVVRLTGLYDLSLSTTTSDVLTIV